MGQGYFDNQLNEYINNAKDFIVLLEESSCSLSACFGINKEDYKTDWFALQLCKHSVTPVLQMSGNISEKRYRKMALATVDDGSQGLFHFT